MEIHDESAGPEETYLQKEAKQYVIHVCQQLKSPYRETALAHFYEEKTAAQIAAEQGKNLKTIQTQIYRSKQMIQKLMKGGTRRDR